MFSSSTTRWEAKVKVRITLLACFLVLSSCICSQTSGDPLLINYTCGNRLNCLALGDREVWLGAQGGLVRFNPQTRQRVKFTPADWRGTCCIAEIVIDSRGVLWASHRDIVASNREAGVVEFDGVQWRWHGTLAEPGYPAREIFGLAADELGYVWFLYGAYVVGFDGAAWHSWRPYEIMGKTAQGIAARRGRGWGVGWDMVCMFEGFDASCTGASIESAPRWIAPDRDDGVWFTDCLTHLVYYEGESFTSFKLPNRDRWSSGYLLRVDKDNTKWFLGRIWGDNDYHADAASLSQDGVWQVYRNLWPAFMGAIGDLRFDSTHAAWISPEFALNSDGDWQPFLIRYDGQGLESFWAFDPVVDTKVEQLCFDADGGVWFTTHDWGSWGRRDYLTHLGDGSFQILWPGQRELPDQINSIAAAPNGDVWFGTDEGAYRFDGQEWDGYLQGERVSKVKIGPGGQVLVICYVSEYARIIKKFEGNTWVTEYEPDWSAQEITDVALDSRGVLWVSCEGEIYEGGPPYDYAGIRSWDGENVSSYSLGNAYGAIVVDHDDVVWAPDGWIYKIESGSVSRLWYDDLGGCYAYAPIYADSGGRKWCHALHRKADYDYQAGLLCIDQDEQVRFYSTSDGLCSGEINDIDEDAYGNIWVSTGRGISVLLEESSFHLGAGILVDEGIPPNLSASTSVSYLGPPTNADLYVAIQAPSGQIFYVAPQGAEPAFPIFYAAFDGSTEFLQPGPDYDGPGSIPNTPDMKDLAPPPLPLPDPTGLALFAYPVPYFANVPLPAYSAIDDLILLNTTLPEAAPTGTYTFHLLNTTLPEAAPTGTYTFHVGITAPSSISNVYRTASTTFEVTAD